MASPGDNRGTLSAVRWLAILLPHHHIHQSVLHSQTLLAVYSSREITFCARARQKIVINRPVAYKRWNFNEL